jgi:hypothetical protein
MYTCLLNFQETFGLSYFSRELKESPSDGPWSSVSNVSTLKIITINKIIGKIINNTLIVINAA